MSDLSEFGFTRAVPTLSYAELAIAQAALRYDPFFGLRAGRFRVRAPFADEESAQQYLDTASQYPAGLMERDVFVALSMCDPYVVNRFGLLLCESEWGGQSGCDSGNCSRCRAIEVEGCASDADGPHDDIGRHFCEAATVVDELRAIEAQLVAEGKTPLSEAKLLHAVDALSSQLAITVQDLQALRHQLQASGMRCATCAELMWPDAPDEAVFCADCVQK